MAPAGAGVAFSLETLGAATNPASMVFLDNRYDISARLFNPNRDYTVTGGLADFLFLKQNYLGDFCPNIDLFSDKDLSGFEKQVVFA